MFLTNEESHQEKKDISKKINKLGRSDSKRSREIIRFLKWRRPGSDPVIVIILYTVVGTNGKYIYFFLIKYDIILTLLTY